MLATAVCTCKDGTRARACRADKMASWFTDFEWLSRTSSDLLPWLPGMPKKVCGAAPGAAADRIHPPTVPGHQGDRPGTPGATSTASDGSDGRSGARDGNPGVGKGLIVAMPEVPCSQRTHPVRLMQQRAFRIPLPLPLFTHTVPLRASSHRTNTA